MAKIKIKKPDKVVAQRRIAERNSLLANIHVLQRTIETNGTTLAVFTKSIGEGVSANDVFYQTQIKKLRDAIRTNTELVRTQSERMESVSAGALDAELANQSAEATIEADKKGNLKRHTKQDAQQRPGLVASQQATAAATAAGGDFPTLAAAAAAAQSKTAVVKKNPFFQHLTPNQQHERDYDMYSNIVAGMPSWLIGKLAGMPNTKGYGWKGVWCLGTQPVMVRRGCGYQFSPMTEIYETDPRTRVQTVINIHQSLGYSDRFERQEKGAPLVKISTRTFPGWPWTFRTPGSS
jgi:hypothetical protein